jgi:hypothetical protein
VCGSFAFLRLERSLLRWRQIRTAIETITADMLQTVWNELDYRVDVCRKTKDAHMRTFCVSTNINGFNGGSDSPPSL